MSKGTAEPKAGVHVWIKGIKASKADVGKQEGISKGELREAATTLSVSTLISMPLWELWLYLVFLDRKPVNTEWI